MRTIRQELECDKVIGENNSEHSGKLEVARILGIWRVMRGAVDPDVRGDHRIEISRAS
jgi:hypothetical protein